MNKIRYMLVLFAFLIAAAISFGGGARQINMTKYAEFMIDSSGDTAQVTTRMPVVAVDSFGYIDSFSYQADTTAHKTITWTSPVQSMILTPTMDTTHTYLCTLVFASTDRLGISYACIEDTSLALLCDSLVANINAETNLTDSVDAQDSGTYVKIVSLFSEVTFGGNWSTTLSAKLDTSSQTTTKSMVCDSMVAAINASANLDSFLTAAVTAAGTTFTITSDDAGVLFWDSSLNDPDTYSVVTRTQANVTSHSTRTDTLPLRLSMVENDFRGSGIYGDIILQLDSAGDTAYGLTISDSGYLWLLTGRLVDTGIVYTAIDSASAADIPCTLHVAKPHAAANDTIFHSFLAIAWRIQDTLTDTTFYREYPISIDMIITDGF